MSERMVPMNEIEAVCKEVLTDRQTSTVANALKENLSKIAYITVVGRCLQKSIDAYTIEQVEEAARVVIAYTNTIDWKIGLEVAVAMDRLKNHLTSQQRGERG